MNMSKHTETHTHKYADKNTDIKTYRAALANNWHKQRSPTSEPLKISHFIDVH